jgi:hypothetical protein
VVWKAQHHRISPDRAAKQVLCSQLKLRRFETISHCYLVSERQQHIGGFAAYSLAAAGSILQTSVDERSNGKAASIDRMRFEANLKMLRITRSAIVLLIAGTILASGTSSRLGTTVGGNPAATGGPPNDTTSR